MITVVIPRLDVPRDSLPPKYNSNGSLPFGFTARRLGYSTLLAAKERMGEVSRL